MENESTTFTATDLQGFLDEMIDRDRLALADRLLTTTRSVRKRLDLTRPVGVLLIAVLVAACAVGGARSEGSTSANSEPQRETLFAFDYYTPVLSWSPTHCSTTDRGTDDGQCARNDGARFGFVLHGLWPQYERVIRQIGEPSC